jgi:hypothetical protein
VSEPYAGILGHPSVSIPRHTRCPLCHVVTGRRSRITTIGRRGMCTSRAAFSAHVEHSLFQAQTRSLRIIDFRTNKRRRSYNSPRMARRPDDREKEMLSEENLRNFATTLHI